MIRRVFKDLGLVSRLATFICTTVVRTTVRGIFSQEALVVIDQGFRQPNYCPAANDRRRDSRAFTSRP